MEAVRHIRLATCGATLGSPMLPTHRGQDTENVPSRGKASRPVLSSTLERARTENQRVAKAERALWARGGGGARITTLTRVGPSLYCPHPADTCRALDPAEERAMSLGSLARGMLLVWTIALLSGSTAGAEVAVVADDRKPKGAARGRALGPRQGPHNIRSPTPRGP